MSFPHKRASVLSVRKNETQKGIYSPYTSFGNYFIFSSSSNSQDSMMILVHALSHMANPESVKSRNNVIMGVMSWFRSSHQPSSQEIYANPAYKHMKYLYGTHLMSTVDTLITLHLQHGGSSGKMFAI